MDKDHIVNKILSLLEKQRFADWYDNGFKDYITGDMAHNTGKTDAECREQIKTDLAQMLNL
jgi:hypothetical protein